MDGGVGQGWGQREKFPLQTAVNGRPGAGWIGGGQGKLLVERGGSGLFRLSLAFALDFSRRVRATGLRWGIDTFSFAFPFSFALSFSFAFAFGRGAYGLWEVSFIIKKRGRQRTGEGATAGFYWEGRADVEGRSGHWVGGTWCQWGAGGGSARRCSRWEIVNSATVDDLSIEACIYEFLSGDTDMGCGISVMLGDELTTLWETDGTIKKREERRWFEWANGWIGVTSRIDAGSAFA